MIEDVLTSDLSKFGYTEWVAVRDILNALLEHGVPDGFYNDGITPMLNTESRYVFLTNSEYQVCMVNNEKLEMVLCCSNCGVEGFESEMEGFNTYFYMCKECYDKEYNTGDVQE